MRLPADYPDIIGGGVGVLRYLGTKLRAEAERRPEAPELWLAVRDLEGLAARLANASEWEWQHGFADILISGQDFGVLDELLPVGEHAADDAPHGVTDAQVRLLSRLRRFLRQYCDREFELDEPAA
jgi:hypothetical protein